MLYYFLPSVEHDYFWRTLMVPIDSHSTEKYYGNQWRPATVQLPCSGLEKQLQLDLTTTRKVCVYKKKAIFFIFFAFVKFGVIL